MNSGFLCPECHQDLGSIAALTSHFQQTHQQQNINSGLTRIKKAFTSNNDHMPSQKALNKEEEERKRLLEDDSLLATSGGVDISAWSRQEIGVRRMRMALFKKYRDTGSGAIKPAASGMSALCETICHLLDVAQMSESDRKAEEQNITVWAPDAVAPHCMNCGLKFGLESTMNLSRRHHCRICGAVVCTDCCQSVLYSGLSEIVNHPCECAKDATVRICEYCLLDIFKLKGKSDKRENESIIVSLYSRFHKTRRRIFQLCGDAKHRTREPIVFKNIAEQTEVEMKKLDRLTKQISHVEGVDVRLVQSLRKLSQFVLQDAKFELLSHRAKMQEYSSGTGSSRTSPSAPSTPLRSLTPIRTPERSNSPIPETIGREVMSLNLKLSDNKSRTPEKLVSLSPNSKVLFPSSVFKYVKLNYQLPTKETLLIQNKNDKTDEKRNTTLNSIEVANSLAESKNADPKPTKSTNPFDVDVSCDPIHGEKLSDTNPFFEEVSSEAYEFATSEAVRSEKEVQIKFLTKEVRRLKLKNKIDEAEIVEQVLNEIKQG